MCNKRTRATLRLLGGFMRRRRAWRRPLDQKRPSEENRLSIGSTPSRTCVAMFHFLKCFAYGSNLCSIRLRERTPSASLVAVAKLEGHVLRFHKVSKDGSGKCNAFATGNSTDYIWGAVFDIDSSDEDRLDRAEGLGYGYERKSVDVESTVGRISVFTYVASGVEAIRSDLRPYFMVQRLSTSGRDRTRSSPGVHRHHSSGGGY